MSDTDTILVSVVIPTYNSSEIIAETLESISKQTYVNHEIVIVDDGSTDSTVEIVESLPGNISLIKQKNCGRGAARNNGVGHMNGKYIAFLDHDDLLLPDSIAERVAYLEENPDIGWVFTDATEFDESGDLRLYLDQFPWLDLKNDHFCQLLKGCFPLTSTVMIRSELLKKVGGFNTDIDYGDDIELFLRLFLVSKVGMIRKPLTRRRIHAGQGVSNTFDRWDSRVKIYGGFTPSSGTITPLQKSSLKEAQQYAYYKLGECYWEKDEFATARQMFLSSLNSSPHFFKAMAYAILCLLPTALIKKLRTLKTF